MARIQISSTGRAQKFSLDINLSEAAGLQLMIYAMQLKAHEEVAPKKPEAKTPSTEIELAEGLEQIKGNKK